MIGDALKLYQRILLTTYDNKIMLPTLYVRGT